MEEDNQKKNELEVKKSEGVGLAKTRVFDEFVMWAAMPQHERIKKGIETQQAFEEFYDVSAMSLWRWKKRTDFWTRVNELHQDWAKNRTGTVVAAIYQTAIKGNPLSQKLWMQVFEGFTEKSEVKETLQNEIGPNDIRFIINGLPEPHKTKFNGYIDEIIITANAFANAQDADEAVWNERPSPDIRDETHQPSQNVSGEERADAVAKSDSGRIRDAVVGETQPGDNQSAERRGEEQTARDVRI